PSPPSIPRSFPGGVMGSPNVRGAVFMMLSMASFALNDVFMKLVFADIGLFQAILLRGLMACAIIATACWATGLFNDWQRIKTVITNRLVAWRSVGEAGATVLFLSALQAMPLANVTAILQVLPLTITLGSALFLGERVGWRRYGAIAIGFVGVMLIVRPGSDGFTVYAFFALGAALFVTVRDLTTRSLPKAIPSLLISLLTALLITMIGALGSLTETWQPVGTVQWVYLASAAVMIMGGYVFSVLAMRDGEVSFIAPFRYSILIWALMLGFFVLNEVPDTLAMIGSAIVVGTGLYTFYRERIVAKKASISDASSAA
ncbi:MAG: DMT family transporter, partial [Pseudomonadota bacterium]